MTRRATRYTGVYERHSETRTFKGKPDVCYDINYKMDGKLKWEKVGWLSEGYSAKLASDIRSERLRSMRHGEEIPSQKQKAPIFGDIAKQYLEWASTNKSRGGIDDKSRYENHLKIPLGNKRLDKISQFDIEKLKNGLLKNELAPATVKHCLVLVRMIVNKAITWRLWTGQNPVQGVRLPALQNERQRFLYHNEARQLLDALNVISPTTHDIAAISLFCGLRFGEIAALRGIDIDMVNGTITVANPKNKTPRKAYMTNDIADILRRRLPENREDLIFPNKHTGEKITMISRTFFKVVQELGFNRDITDRRMKVCFHTLRHTHASWLAMSGESLLTIQQSLGHKDLQMVKRYAHLGADTRKQAAQRLEDGFNKAEKDDVVVPLKR